VDVYAQADWTVSPLDQPVLGVGGLLLYGMFHEMVEVNASLDEIIGQHDSGVLQNNCWTINNLLQNPDVKTAFKAALKKSMIGSKKAHEEGGFIFEHARSGQLLIVPASPGDVDSLDKFWNDYAKLAKGPDFLLLAWYHTHPNGTNFPSGKQQDTGDQAVSGDLTKRNGRSIPGVVLTKGNQPTVFDLNATIYENDGRRNICLLDGIK
jgi:hypothetical protein